VVPEPDAPSSRPGQTRPRQEVRDAVMAQSVAVKPEVSRDL